MGHRGNLPRRGPCCRCLQIRKLRPGREARRKPRAPIPSHLSLLPPLPHCISHSPLESPHPPAGLWSLMGSPRDASHPPTCTETPLHAEACAQTGSPGPGLSGGGRAPPRLDTHTHWLEYSGRRPPPPWETSGQRRDVGFRTEWCRDRGWEAREVAPHSFPDEVGQLSPHGSPPGSTDKEETASRGPRSLPPISRCPAPCGLEGGHADGPQSWEGGEPRGSGRQPGTRAQARLPGVDG